MTTKTSQFRNVASQCIAALLATNVVMFNAGNFYGFTTILLAVVSEKNAEIEVSVSDLTWLSTYFFNKHHYVSFTAMTLLSYRDYPKMQ